MMRLSGPRMRMNLWLTQHGACKGCRAGEKVLAFIHHIVYTRDIEATDPGCTVGIRASTPQFVSSKEQYMCLYQHCKGAICC